MSLRKRRKREPLKMPELTLTPLIDTAFNLLIVFMITSPVVQTAIKMNLPKGQSKDITDTKQEIIISFDGAGNLYFNKDKEPSEEKKLIKKIQEALGKDKKRMVFVKADEKLNYGKVVEFVDRLKNVGGIEYVALAMQQKSSKVC